VEKKRCVQLHWCFRYFVLTPHHLYADEVDGAAGMMPNVGRYARFGQRDVHLRCNLSNISHNKIAMEMAHSAMGVTMH